MGGSPGLVVMGVDSCPEGRGFESQHLMAKLAERLLLIPEIRGSNPVISKLYNEHINVNC